MKANLRVISLPLNRRPRSDSGFDYDVIYVEPWLEVLSSKFNIYFHDECDFSERPPGEKVLVIGHLPYNWSAEMKRQLDGFMHIVVDKYLFQASPFPVRFRTSCDAKRLISRLYDGFSPGKVLVNSRVMKEDFDSSFCTLGIPASVEVLYHPVTLLSKEKGELITHFRNTSISPQILYDSFSPVSRQIKTLSLISRDLSLLCLDYNQPIESLKSKNIIALLNIRANFPFSRRFFNSRKTDGYSVFFKALCFDITSRLVAFFRGNRGRYALSSRYYDSLNARWKPSTKASAAMAMNIAYVGIDEAANSEFANLFSLKSYSARSMNKLFLAIRQLESDASLLSTQPPTDACTYAEAQINAKLTKLVADFADPEVD